MFFFDAFSAQFKKQLLIEINGISLAGYLLHKYYKTHCGFDSLCLSSVP